MGPKPLRLYLHAETIANHAVKFGISLQDQRRIWILEGNLLKEDVHSVSHYLLRFDPSSQSAGLAMVLII